MKRLCQIVVFLFTTSSYGASFIPIPISEQIEESDAIFRGIYLNERYKKLPSGEVVTIASFKLKSQVGFRYNELLNRNKIDVLYPGGLWQGLKYFVHGSPRFNKQEEVLLLIKKTRFGLTVTNLSLGKYIFKSNGNLSSSVFTGHAKLGDISLNTFNMLAKNKFGAPLEKVGSLSFRTKKKKAIRSLASTNNDKNNSYLTNDFSILGLVILFSILGFLYNKLIGKWEER